MPKLPRRILFFSIVFLVLSLFIKLHFTSAANPQDILLDTSVDTLNQQGEQARITAQQEGATQVFDRDVMIRFAGVMPYALASQIGCIDQKYCNEKYTMMGALARAIGTIYANPPASGIYYAYDMLENSGILVKPAYAQGIGFAGLSPLLPLWKVTRNISYSVMIVIMIAIGFMVIFRMKIDPKTVISVQAALPKIVITLILITLSYPIIGFLVDLMYLSTAIIVSLLANGFEQSSRVAEFQTYFLTADFGDLFKTVFSGGFSTLDDFFKRNFTAYLGSGTAVGIIALILQAGWWAVLIGGGAIGALFILILFLGLLFTFIRIFLLLLNSYIQLLIALVIGPLQLLLEAVPGRSAFSQWIMNVIANLVVFPTTVAILMFAQYLAQINTDTGSLFSPPFISMPGKGSFTAFLGLGVLFLAPTLIATVKKAFHPKPLLPITAGTAFAPLTGATQTTMGAASQFYYLQSTMQNLPGPLKGIFGGGQKPTHRGN
ncbi:hypothetical protein A2777_04055 [Candidatus Gottesmanbacteria bacterium RIFCSPHIGHO2_01_FULL_40_15]|uniref:Uncharacterized protein n=1 Tax=Candidatus Gottesmanbacteria bacterium RIFCSPHIGHO2_01_FULL_40_15 TaxID=1798376 RepID=A0A1F5Z3W8_9BACT|nr:MAG: hypothetical protein A2777_04055 [Candidatus Gottesmanbacteria bacterium RIFCSPHIGHO2_01_FULL_40_15]